MESPQKKDMQGFALHPRLLADTFAFEEWGLSSVRLLNDRRFPRFLLIPRRPDLREIHDMASADRAVLIEEIAKLSKAMTDALKPEKMNVAALGNHVPQLHVHVVARFKNDIAWPEPIWGIGGGTEPYTDAAQKKLTDTLREILKRG